MIPVYRSSGSNVCPYINAISRYTGWSEIKFETTPKKAKPSKHRKQKETTFVGLLFLRTKLVFVSLTNYYQLFHDFLDEIDTSRSPGIILVTRHYINPGRNTSLGQRGGRGLTCDRSAININLVSYGKRNSSHFLGITLESTGTSAFQAIRTRHAD